MQAEEEFSITTEDHDGCVLLIVRGDLDELTADTLDQALIGVRDGRPVIVDLSETTFICSTSIRVLVKERPEGRPALVAPEGQITRVLKIVEASRTNKMFTDWQTAIQSLGLSQVAATG